MVGLIIFKRNTKVIYVGQRYRELKNNSTYTVDYVIIRNQELYLCFQERSGVFASHYFKLK